jgi:hypothetical protein
MNKLIATIFGRMLSTIHLIVILSFIAVIFNFHESKNSLVALLGKSANNDIDLLGFFLLYVLFIGSLSTFISMNEHLEEISNALKKKSK